MEDHEAKLGAFFRHIRKRRGLKIRDVSASISETTLSRFERGQIDLTISKLAPAMEAAEMDPGDVLLRPNQAKASFDNALTTVRIAIVRGNKAMATAALHNYKNATENMTLPLRPFNLLILETLTQSIKTPTLYLTLADQDAVITFLERDDDWHHFEYMLYGELVYFMDQKHSERAFRIMTRSFIKRDHPENDRDAYEFAMMNAIMRPIESDDLNFAGEIMKRIEAIKISPLDLLNNYRRELLRTAFTYKQTADDDNHATLKHLLESLSFLGSSQLADKDQEWLDRCGIKI